MRGEHQNAAPGGLRVADVLFAFDADDFCQHFVQWPLPDPGQFQNLLAAGDDGLWQQFAGARFAYGAGEVGTQGVPVAGAAMPRQPARQRAEAVHPDKRQAGKEAKYKNKHGAGGKKKGWS